MKRKPNSNKISTQLYNLFFDITSAIACAILEALLWMARFVWKRYFGIETPLYRYWWKEHKKYIQKRIYREHPEFVTA